MKLKRILLMLFQGLMVLWVSGIILESVFNIGLGPLGAEELQGTRTASTPNPSRTGRLTSTILSDNKFKVVAVSPGIPPEEAEKLIGDLSSKAILALQDRDFERLARWVHPVKGITFGTGGLSGHFSASDMVKVFDDPQIRSWGDDFEGNEVKCAFKEFFNGHIFTKDFAKAPIHTFNNYILMSAEKNPVYGNDTSNIVSEYVYPGFDPKEDGLDRQALSLIFGRGAKSRWYVVSVFRDRFTP